MTEDYLLKEEYWNEVKTYVKDELEKRGCILPDVWTPGAMAYDIIVFTYKNKSYHMCVSMRQNNCFGFIIVDLENYFPIVNETISYNNYKETILNKWDVHFRLDNI